MSSSTNKNTMLQFFIICAVIIFMCVLVNTKRLGDIEAFVIFVSGLFAYLIIFE